MHMVPPNTLFRSLMIGLLFLPARPADAQSVGRGELIPVVGATWHMRALQRIPEVPQVVRPVVWPFADLESNDVFGVSYTMNAASEVPLAASYPQADQVLHAHPDDGSPATDIVLDVQADRCLELLNATAQVSSVYDPGALLAAYPLTLGTPVDAAYCFMSVSTSALIAYCGTTEITFEQVGLLQLPFGEYPDAHLIRIRRNKVNLADPSDSSLTETLTWYAADVPYPLLRITTTTYPDGTQAHEGHLLDPTSLVGMADRSEEEALVVYPNPSSGEVHFNAAANGELRIHGVDGKLMRTERITTGATPVRIDLSALAPGTYRMVLVGDRRTWSAPLVVVH